MEEKRPEPRSRWLDVGWLIAGAIILFVGAYYVIRNTLGFNLPELNGEAIWPLAVIALGIGKSGNARKGPAPRDSAAASAAIPYASTGPEPNGFTPTATRASSPSVTAGEPPSRSAAPDPKRPAGSALPVSPRPAPTKAAPTLDPTSSPSSRSTAPRWGDF